MSLEEQLAKMRERSASMIPEAVRKVMHQFNEELTATGILDRCIQVGDRLPSFSLPNAEGTLVHSEDVLARGSLVLTVYRGHW